MVKNAKCYKLRISHDENVTDLDVKYDDPVLLDLSKTFSVPVADEFFEVSCEMDNLLKAQVFKYHYAQIVPDKNGKNIKNK